MNCGYKIKNWYPLFFMLAGAFVCSFVAGSVSAQMERADDVEEIESVIDLEEAVSEIRDGDAQQGAQKRLSSDEESMIEPMDFSEVQLEGSQIVKINRSIKHLIEENERLRREKSTLELQLGRMRGERRIESTRLNAIIQQRDMIKDRVDTALEENKAFSDQVVNLADMLKKRQLAIQEYDKQVGELRQALQEKEELLSVSIVSPVEGDQGEVLEPLSPLEIEEDVLAMIDRMQRVDVNIRVNEAKIRYNMGNTFFQNGEYQKAVREYQEALRLAPLDASAHFNLAFIYGEYLKEVQKSVDHYKKYLELYPNAPDYAFVKEKILEAELSLRAKVASPLDKTR